MERIAAACSDYVASSSQMRVEQASKEGGKGKESGVGVGGARIEAIEKKKKGNGKGEHIDAKRERTIRSHRLGRPICDVPRDGSTITAA